MTDVYDPTSPSCAWCYFAGGPAGGDLKKCSKCTRRYCSRGCQVNDWKAGSHKFWCGKAGEKCVDYEIRSAGDKGLGLFALRDFVRGENVLVERSVMTRHAGSSFTKDALNNPHTYQAIMSLAPVDNMDLMVKFLTNCAALTGDEDEGSDGGSGLFLHFSRANHHCIGNCAHYFDPLTQVKRLIADRAIAAGTEITFSYAGQVSCRERTQRLMMRGFQCNCEACRTPELAQKLDRMIELDRKILSLGQIGKTDAAILAGKALLQIYDELQSSDTKYSRTHYDLFSMNISRKRTLKAGIAHLQKAHEYALRFYGEKDKTVLKYARLLVDPSQHPNYLLLG